MKSIDERWDDLMKKHSELQAREKKVEAREEEIEAKWELLKLAESVLTELEEYASKELKQARWMLIAALMSSVIALVVYWSRVWL